MHLLPIQRRSLDDEAPAVELDLSPAEVLILSFTDSDLAVTAAAWEQARADLPSLRLIALSDLKHPFSVDRFIETLATKAHFVLVRLLGGADYWRYGVDELAVAARRNGFMLAVLPGDGFDDPRLDEASTLPADRLRLLWRYFQAGGADNVEQALRLIASTLGRATEARPPQAVPDAGLHPAVFRSGVPDAPHALLIFYRSALLAADLAPILALADALQARGARVSGFFVTSLKDPASEQALDAFLAATPTDVILNTTAFSARSDAGCILDRADAPVLQAILSTADRETWSADPRGLGAADLAMNVVLPEVDGRIGAGVISFKRRTDRHGGLEYSRVVHEPDLRQVARVADRAVAWANLRRVRRGDRRLVCVLSDYPGKEGRAGYAVGLDTPASTISMAAHLRAAGFDIGRLPASGELMRDLAQVSVPILALGAYRTLLERAPKSFAASVLDAWGDPASDPACRDGVFQIPLLQSGKLIVAVQPDRGARHDRRTDYHDPARPPCHGYVAFYLWLRFVVRPHAMIHMGTHGTLEWLPGKAVALSGACAPAVLLGAIPVVYPFIVNNPGEAAQAKRRLGAVTIGHLTPPLVEAGLHGGLAELEQLFDEYAEATTLDRRRATILAEAIKAKAVELNLLGLGGSHQPTDSPQPLMLSRPVGPSRGTGKRTALGPSFETPALRAPQDEGDESAARSARDEDTILAALDAWLCDIKEARIGDGLHIFGAAPDLTRHAGTCEALDATLPAGEAEAQLLACGEAETANLLRALDGRFVPPGPAGAPTRGRADVLPTGRNLFTIDPRGLPTRTAWTIGQRLAEDLVTRYAQDHGEWPRRVVLDLWGSATMRTGGDDLAQALALMGVRPVWDHASARVNGFEILPLATLGRSRVDITLRISGLFRDTFPDQITMLAAAVRAVAGLDESDDDNPLVDAQRTGASLARVFGPAPGAYGVGVAAALTADRWTERSELGEVYLASTSHQYGTGGQAAPATTDFRHQVAGADAFTHTGDLPGQDVLDSDTFADHEGGFAAAAALLGAQPTLYRADTTRPDDIRVRSLSEDLTRALHARATNPRWIAGQMRHGYRGASAMAETLDALFGFAATTDAVPSRHFDLYFDATLGDDSVRDFLERENPAAARAMAAKFDTAIRRTFWDCRRNSPRAILAGLQGIAA